MFGSVWSWAGNYRKTVTNIGVHPTLIHIRTLELCEEVKYWCTEPVELSFLEQAARIHHRMVFIHPLKMGMVAFLASLQIAI